MCLYVRWELGVVAMALLGSDCYCVRVCEVLGACVQSRVSVLCVSTVVCISISPGVCMLVWLRLMAGFY